MAVRTSTRCLMPAALMAGLVLQSAVGNAGAQKAAPGPTAREDRCTRNLDHVYKLIRAYQHHSGGLFPATINDLLPMTHNRTLFQCALGRRVEIVSDPTKPSFGGVPASDIAIVADLPNHGRDVHVLFYDGAVRILTVEQFDALRKNGYVK